MSPRLDINKHLLSLIFLPIFVVLLLGCQKAPEMPTLRSYPAKKIEKVTLGSQGLTAKELKSILQSLNEHGDLNGLRNLSVHLSDSEWDTLSSLLGDLLRDDPRGRAFASRVLRSDLIKDWNEWLEVETFSEGAQERRDWLFSLLSSNKLDDASGSLIRLLHPRVLDLWRQAGVASSKSFVGLKDTGPEITFAEFGKDLAQLMVDRDHSIEICNLADSLTRYRAWDDLYLGIRKFSEDRRDSAINPFEGVRAGFAQMIKTGPYEFQAEVDRDNQLDLLLHFAEIASQDSKGFFPTLEKGLKDFSVNAGDFAQDMLQEIVSRVLAERIRLTFSEKLSDKASFISLFKEHDENKLTYIFYELVVESWETVIGKVDGSQPASNRLSVHLNALTVAKWLELNFRSHIEKVNSLPEDGFSRALWNMDIEFKPLDMQYVVEKENSLEYPYEALMNQGELGSILALLKNYTNAKLEPFRRFHYQVVSIENAVALNNGLTGAMITIDRKRKVVSGETLVRIVLQYLTEPTLSSGQNIATFETSNLLNYLNGILSGISITRFRSVHRILFEQLELGRLDEEKASLLLQLFSSEPKFRDMVQSLLHSAESINEFDKPIGEGLYTPMELYHAVLTQTSPERVPWVSELLVYLSENRVAGFHKDGTAQYQFPFFIFGLQSQAFSKSFAHVAAFPLQSWYLVQEVVLPGFQNGGAKNACLWFGESLEGPGNAGWASWLDWIKQHPLPNSDINWTESEWQWLLEAAVGGRIEELTSVFKALTREEWHQVVREMRRLESEGTLTRVVGLLGLIQDDSMRDISALLKTGIESGRVGALLAALEKLLAGGVP